jgi:antitoxin Phd
MEPMRWQTQEARQRFSELVRRAQEDGPQIATRHGEEVVVLSTKEFHRLRGDTMEFRDVLMTGPPTDDLEIERNHTPGREVILPDV